MTKVPTISVSLLNSVIFPAAQKGVSKAVLLKAIDVDESLLDNPENRVPCVKMSQAIKIVTELSGDPDFPIYYGQHFQPATYNVVGYILANAPNLASAYRQVLKYTPLVGDGLILDLEEEGQYSKITLKIIDEKLNDFLIYLLPAHFGQHLTAIRQLLGKDINPTRVDFAHPAPESLSAYNKFFQCPLFFNAESHQIFFEKSILGEPISQANPALYKMFNTYAEEILNRTTDQESVHRKVSELLIQLITTNEATIEKVATNLSIGVRTLQRQLKDEGVTFNKLLNDVRKEIALQHLKSNQLTLTEISYILGFSEPSVFHRSFKKWTGKTPRDYRVNFAGAHL